MNYDFDTLMNIFLNLGLIGLFLGVLFGVAGAVMKTAWKLAPLVFFVILFIAVLRAFIN